MIDDGTNAKARSSALEEGRDVIITFRRIRLSALILLKLQCRMEMQVVGLLRQDDVVIPVFTAYSVACGRCDRACDATLNPGSWGFGQSSIDCSGFSSGPTNSLGACADAIALSHRQQLKNCILVIRATGAAYQYRVEQC